MTKRISQGFSLVTLAAWGVLFILFARTGRAVAYLTPTFRALVEPAGWVLVALAVVYLLFVVFNRKLVEDDPCRPSANEFRLHHVLGFVVLLLPVGAAVFAKEGYTADAVANKGYVEDVSTLGGSASKRFEKLINPENKPAVVESATPLPSMDQELALPTIGGELPQDLKQSDVADATPENYLPKNDKGYILAEVVDLLFAAQEPTLRPDFDGKMVEMIGQVMPENTMPHDGRRFRLMRMWMVCCAADARPVAVTVEAPSKPEFAEMSWVKITGKPAFETIDGRLVPVVKAETLEASEPPSELMLF